MTEPQREWLVLANADGDLPIQWPKGRAGNGYVRGVRGDLRQRCAAAGWVVEGANYTWHLTDAGRAALGEKGKES